MSEAQRYGLASENIVSESFPEEIVLVNLDNGNYYSLVKTGVDVWQGIQEGLSAGEIAAKLTELYTGSSKDIETSVQIFLQAMLDEGLISPLDAAAPATHPQEMEPRTAIQGNAPFEAPELQRFTDMQELLLLDPVHDVNESGWPNTPGDTTRNN